MCRSTWREEEPDRREVLRPVFPSAGDICGRC
jgi:hypothetical protein